MPQSASPPFKTTQEVVMASNEKPCTVPLTVRVSEPVREKLINHCAENGLKIGPFVEKAIKEKLEESK